MPINPLYKATYEEGCFYHIFNRAHANQNLFNKEDNYRFFIEKFDRYLSPFVDVYAWCLLPNHFHFLIRVKSNHKAEPKFGTLQEFRTFASENIHEEITKSFKNFFISYSKSYKVMFNLSTNVFAPKYKHIQLKTENDICALIQYIHRNPLHHNVSSDWQTYKWSSFKRLKNKSKSKLKRKQVFELFGGYDEFLRIHNENIKLYKDEQSYEFQ